jgi:hypothetical protein
MIDAEIDVEQVPPAREMPPERREALRELLMTRVSPPHRPWWRRSKQAGIAGLGVSALVLAGGAAAAYVAFKPASDKLSVICYSEAKLGDDVRRVTYAEANPVTASSKPSTETATIADPERACAELWQSGVLSPDATGRPDASTKQPAADGGTAKPVPKLVACTTEDNVAAVFPGDDKTCERLGLPRTSSSPPK